MEAKKGQLTDFKNYIHTAQVLQCCFPRLAPF